MICPLVGKEMCTMDFVHESQVRQGYHKLNSKVGNRSGCGVHSEEVGYQGRDWTVAFRLGGATWKEVGGFGPEP